MSESAAPKGQAPSEEEAVPEARGRSEDSLLGRAERQAKLNEVEEQLAESRKAYLRAISEGIVTREKKANREAEKKAKEKEDLMETHLRKMKRDAMRVGREIKPGTEAFFQMQDKAWQMVHDEYDRRENLPEREAHEKERTKDRSLDKYGAEPEVLTIHKQLNELRAEKRLLSPPRKPSKRGSPIDGGDSKNTSRKSSSTKDVDSASPSRKNSSTKDVDSPPESRKQSTTKKSSTKKLSTIDD